MPERYVQMTDDPSGAPGIARRRAHPAVLVGAAVILVVIGAVIGLVVSGDDQRSRQDVVADRGAAVMGFDLERTTHVFEPAPFGGEQTVLADDPRDVEQVALIRRHLRHEVERFRAGDFGDPAAIHGHDMPGLAVLEERAAEIGITLDEVTSGARVTYRSEEPDLVAALHEWFAAQLSDHGEHARAG